MSYTSRGKLTFISRYEDPKEWMKPVEQLMKAPIQIGKVRLHAQISNKIAILFKNWYITYFKFLIFFSQVRHIPKHLNLTEIRKNIATNLTCIENQPEQGKILWFVYLTSFITVANVMVDLYM